MAGGSFPTCSAALTPASTTIQAARIEASGASQP